GGGGGGRVGGDGGGREGKPQRGHLLGDLDLRAVQEQGSRVVLHPVGDQPRDGAAPGEGQDPRGAEERVGECGVPVEPAQGVAGRRTGHAARRLSEPGQSRGRRRAGDPRRHRRGHRCRHRRAERQGSGGAGAKGRRGDHQEDAVEGLRAVCAMAARPLPSAALRVRGGTLAIVERWVERNLPWLLPAPAVAVMLALMVFPLAYTAYLSLHQWYASSVLGPELVWFKNYADLFARDERFWPTFRVTCYFTIGAVTLTLGLGLGVAHLLVRAFPGRGLARTIMLMPMIATPVAMALVWMTMMSPTIGVLNYVLRSLGLGGSACVSSPRSVIPSL